MKHWFTYDYRCASTTEVHRLCVKYLKMLGVDGLFPEIKIRANLGSRWLGRATFKPVSRVCLVEIQKSITGDPTTLERVIAHEMCHVAEYANLSPEDLSRAKAGLDIQDHSTNFMGYAAIINGHMGANFVSRTSDQSYKQEETTKPYTLLIAPTDYYKDVPTQLYYSIGVRLSGAMAAYVERQRAEYKGRIIVITDAQWALGAKIGKGWSVPKPDQEAALWKLYEQAR